MTSLTIATLNAVFQHALPHDVRALQQRVRELEAQRMSPYVRADGTMKTWQRLAVELQQELKDTRDEQESAWGAIHQATELLQGARAHAGRVNVETFNTSGPSAPQHALEVVHNIICNVVNVLEEEHGEEEHENEDEDEDDGEESNGSGHDYDEEGDRWNGGTIPDDGQPWPEVGALVHLHVKRHHEDEDNLRRFNGMPARVVELGGRHGGMIDHTHGNEGISIRCIFPYTNFIRALPGGPSHFDIYVSRTYQMCLSHHVSAPQPTVPGLWVPIGISTDRYVYEI